MNLGRLIVTDYGRGRVYKRGAIWWIQYHVHGKRHRESSESTKKSVAVRKLEERLHEYRNRPPDDRVPMFETAEKALVDDYAANGRKSDPEERMIHLRPAFAGLDLRRVTTAKLRAYAHARRNIDGAANATINREFACLRRMMNLMREDGILMSVPHFPMRKENNVRTGFVEEDELQAVLEHLPDAVQPVVEFAYVTGWRKGEILSRDWKHVTDRAVRLDPLEAKNEDGREFPLIPRLQAVIDGQRERMGDTVGGPLFFWTPGRRIKSFRESWKKAVGSAGLPELLFHDLRRSAVRNLVLAGIDEHTAMKLTGHKTRSVFDRYDIVDSNRLHEQATKLEAFYGDQEPKVSAIK